jgi:hypothetical protein
MTGNLIKIPDLAYEDVVARLEETQSRMLENDDIPWAARSAGMLAAAATDLGNISLAEACHRTAIHAYNLDYAAKAFGIGAEHDPLVSPEALEEYLRLAVSLSSGHRTIHAHRKLHHLKREALTLGPLEFSLAIQGIAVVAETEARLATHSFTRREAHARRAKQLDSVYEVAGQGGGLPLQLIKHYESPRTVETWIQDINRANIL